MFHNFYSAQINRYPLTLRGLKNLCQKANSLEEMVYTWCSKKRSLLVSTDFSGDTFKVIISFFIKGRLLGTVELEIEELFKRYGYVKPIVVKDSPDPDFFNQRKSKLKLFVHDDLKCPLRGKLASPPESMVELIISYASCNYGFAEVKVCETSEKFFNLKLIAIQPGAKVGWVEDFLIDKNSLQYLLEFERLKLEGVFH